jgi:hypothetical protein
VSVAAALRKPAAILVWVAAIRVSNNGVSVAGATMLFHALKSSESSAIVAMDVRYNDVPGTRVSLAGHARVHRDVAQPCVAVTVLVVTEEVLLGIERLCSVRQRLDPHLPSSVHLVLERSWQWPGAAHVPESRHEPRAASSPGGGLRSPTRTRAGSRGATTELLSPLRSPAARASPSSHGGALSPRV